MIYPRKPRFRRSSDIASIELTERDEKIIRFIHRHRFLRSSHLGDLIGGSCQQLLRRLQALYHHGYLERPLCQLDYFQKGGSRSMVYGLGSKGAAFLRRVDNVPFSKIDWSGKNQTVKRVFLDHALMVSDIMVALEISCRNHSDVRLLMEHQLAFPDTTKNLRNSSCWKVTVLSVGAINVIPDRVFALEFAGTQERILYFLEADRGTMPLRRKNSPSSCLERKLIAYQATWIQKLHHSRFGFERLRILTVTTNNTRLQHIQEIAKQLSRGRGIFLFTDIHSLKQAEDALSELC